ncbi:hypothetical protein ACNHYB_06185 [Isoptericola jiangsuensis]|uniref:hypothetical protein n=1 Tax=Isoptericola jiangsuensis TaxID=548579 RepID=UPI003AAEDE6C
MVRPQELDPVRTATARLAVAHRHANGGGCGDPTRIAEAEAALEAAYVEREINRRLDHLTIPERVRLGAMLMGSAFREMHGAQRAITSKVLQEV